MLILQRKKNEAIRIGDNITIIVTDVGNDSVRLAIEAPTDNQLKSAARDWNSCFS